MSLFDKDGTLDDNRENATANTNDAHEQREAMARQDLDNTQEVNSASGDTQENSLQKTHRPEPTITASPLAKARPEPRLEVASRCHIGKVRARNEDTSFVFVSQGGGSEPLPVFGLFIVADGMGGHDDGHRASKLVARTVAHHVLDRLYGSLLQEGHSAMQQPVQEAMEEAVLLANKALAGAETGKEMGTTLTAAVILGSRLFLVHIGDSRAYLLHENKLSLVTTDHTFVQALQDAGQLTAEEAATHPNRNLLYRALMGETMEEPIDVFTRTLPRDGSLMLCSDGLWGAVDEVTIASILNDDIVLQEKADRLLNAALEAGGSDNVTFILVSFVL